MSKFIEKLVEKQLNEHRRKSKTLLIVYKCRCDEMRKTKTNTNRLFHKNQLQYFPDGKCRERDDSKIILGTPLTKRSNSLETSISQYFDESSNSSNSLQFSATSSSWSSPKTFKHDKFPYNHSKLLYWNIKMDKHKQNSEGNCEKFCYNRRKPKTSSLHLDVISRLRLQSFIRSLCEDKNNFDFCHPPTSEDDINRKRKIQRKRAKAKKKCKCIKDPSTVSFHITVPKQTKSILLKNNPIIPKSNSNQKNSDKKNEDSKKCKNSPFSTSTNQVHSGNIPDNVTMNVGNQIITISVKKVTSENTDVTQQFSTYNRDEENQAIKSCTCPSNKRSPPRNKENKCECSHKITKNIKKDIKNYVLSQLNNYSVGNSGTSAYVSKKRLENSREKRQKLFHGRNNQSCGCEKIDNYAQFGCPESYDEDGELPEGDSFKAKYTQCVKIYVEPQIENEDENFEDPDNEYYYPPNQTQYVKCKARNKNMCEYKGCSAIYERLQHRSNYTNSLNESTTSDKKSHPCRNYTKQDKCCSCFENSEEEDTCLCPRSKTRLLKDTCCQCQPSQNKNTQIEITLNKTTDTKVSAEDIIEDTNDLENEVNEAGTQSTRNGVTKTYIANTSHSSSKKRSQLSFADPLMRDGFCSCCICDEESSDDNETSEHVLRMTESEDDDLFYEKNSSERRSTEQFCECRIKNTRPVEKKYSNPVVKRDIRSKQFERCKNLHLCNLPENCYREPRIPSYKKNPLSFKQEVNSTEDLLKNDCDNLEQIIAELDEYCKNKSVNFEVSYYTDTHEFGDKGRAIRFAGSKTEESVCMARENQSKTMISNFQSSPLRYEDLKTLIQENASVATLQIEGLSNRKNNPQVDVRPRGATYFKYRWPSRTSSKLSDQRLNRIKKIESGCKKIRIKEKVCFLIL